MVLKQGNAAAILRTSLVNTLLKKKGNCFLSNELNILNLRRLLHHLNYLMMGLPKLY